MEKVTIKDVVNDLRARRDCLSLAHENIKNEADQYNKIIIVLSLLTGAIESTKIKMGWNGDSVALIPIFLSSIIGMISALAKFRDFPTKLETLVQAISLLTNTLTKARNHEELDDDLLTEYNNALQSNETALYPDIRRTYLRQAHKNLLCIMDQEAKYYENIKKVNSGQKMDIKCDSSDSSISIKHVNSFQEEEPEQKEEHKEVHIEMNELDESNHREKPLKPIIEEELDL